MRLLVHLAWIAALLIATAGCGARRFYDGPARPRHEVAVLVDSDDPDFKVYRIDGRMALAENELLPGTYRIGILHAGESIDGHEFRARCYLTLEARAGEEYVVAGRSKDTLQPVLFERGVGVAGRWQGGVRASSRQKLAATCDCYEQWERSDCAQLAPEPQD